MNNENEKIVKLLSGKHGRAVGFYLDHVLGF